MSAKKKKSPRQMFTHDEDAKLRYIINDFHAKNRPLDWNEISSQMGTKNARQCKDRWCYYLDDNVDRSPFTSNENYLLLWSINRLGKKWTQISQLFPNRTDVSIKAQYKKLIRRNATLENVFKISNAKYYKHPKKKEEPEKTEEPQENNMVKPLSPMEPDLDPLFG